MNGKKKNPYFCGVELTLANANTEHNTKWLPRRWRWRDGKMKRGWMNCFLNEEEKWRVGMDAYGHRQSRPNADC
jgi:hypothetical protein